MQSSLHLLGNALNLMHKHKKNHVLYIVISFCYKYITFNVHSKCIKFNEIFCSMCVSWHSLFLVYLMKIAKYGKYFGILQSVRNNFFFLYKIFDRGPSIQGT